jgi:sec-independent protein translocase protein TatC
VESIKEIFHKFSPFLEDIQRRLYITSIIFIVSFAAGFFSTSRLLKVILSFFVIEDVVIATTSPFQFADLSIDIGLFSAFLICFPVFAYHAYLFLRPALSRRERIKFFAFIPMTVILFVFGFSYGFLILYYALLVLAKINVVVGVQNIWDIGMFLSQIILTSAFLGALFQFPLVVTYLIRAGFISVTVLKSKRRVALFIIFVFTTLLPPTDGLSLLAMALPLILLYEITILVNSRVGKVSMINNRAADFTRI